MAKSTWSSAQDKLAIKYLQEGRTFREVGKLLHYSRNAVLSRARRQNWDYPNKRDPNVVRVKYEVVEKSPRPRTNSFAFGRKFSPVPLLPQKESISDRIPRNASYLDTTPEGHCRFIYGDARGRLCCGRKTHEKYSWCLEHMYIVFSPRRLSNQAH